MAFFALTRLLALSLLIQTSLIQAESIQPEVSIITSIYNGDEFIEGFLADITKQTVFSSKCELILINANSPGNEEPIIKKYMALYPNIIYEKLNLDPGLYAVWNHAIKKARGTYIMNGNLDDRSRYDAIEAQLKVFQENPGIDLTYSSHYVTEIANETFDNCHWRWYSEPKEFSSYNMRKCLPGPRPMWKKSLHERFGYFDESYKMVGDWEMWLRATSQGAQFKKIPEYFTLFYQNPKGLSTDDARAHERGEEGARIYSVYHAMMDP